MIFMCIICYYYIVECYTTFVVVLGTGKNEHSPPNRNKPNDIAQLNVVAVI